jgi:hypothetical protein
MGIGSSDRRRLREGDVPNPAFAAHVRLSEGNAHRYLD